jgi:hypothetical protein
MMDGESWTARQEEDFLGKPESFRTYLYQKARKAGLCVKVDLDGNLVHFQFRKKVLCPISQ